MSDHNVLGFKRTINRCGECEHFRAEVCALHKGVFYAEDEACRDFTQRLIVGMYEINNPEYHKVNVGRYTICRQNDKGVWFQNGQDEGAEFSDELVEKALDDFWRDHF